MPSQRSEDPFRIYNPTLQIVAGCVLGLILGNVCFKTSVLLMLGVLAAALCAYAVLKRPEIALLGILIATSTIVFEERLPLLSFGPISFHIPDVLLLGLLGLVVVRWLIRPEFKLVRTPLDIPLLVFYGVTLLSTLMAIAQSSADPTDARREIRVLSYYLAFFVVTNLVRGLRQLNLLLNGIFLLATGVAGGMVAQFLLGSSVRLMPGRIESLGTQGTMYEDITRILPPGWSIVLVSFLAILCIMSLEKAGSGKWPKFLQTGLFGIALLVTFLRSFWAALIVAFILMAYLFRGRERQRLMNWSSIATLLAVLILLVIYSDSGSRAARLVDASFARLNTLGKSGTFQGEDDSLNWRKVENTHAFSTIRSHPLLGVGMGARYRPWDPRLDHRTPRGYTADLRRLIHNGHLKILVQSGLLGYICFLWLSLTFLFRGFKYWRDINDFRKRGVVLGFTLTYVVLLIASFANSSFVQWRWTPILGIMMGINEVVHLKFKRAESPA